MATNAVTREHLLTVADAVSAAINNVNRYQGYNGEMTEAAKTILLATVTTVPAGLIHASDCAICTAWDGSDSA
jgi:hypothetical protein